MHTEATCPRNPRMTWNLACIKCECLCVRVKEKRCGRVHESHWTENPSPTYIGSILLLQALILLHLCQFAGRFLLLFRWSGRITYRDTVVWYFDCRQFFSRVRAKEDFGAECGISTSRVTLPFVKAKMVSPRSDAGP